jgi:polyadenylation factor subunit 2
LWDARAAKEIAQLHLHKNTINQLRWHPNGNFLLSGARDQLIKLLDLRAMRESAAFKGHKKEVNALAWHPMNAELFCSGANDGTIYFWSTLHTDAPLEQSLGARGNAAHEQSVACMAWHPLGHLLCSGANDNLVKFWSRNRPGDGRKRVRETDADDFDDELEMRMLSLAQLAQQQTQPGQGPTGLQDLMSGPF